MTAEIGFRPIVLADYHALIALWQRCDGVEAAEGDDETSFRAYLHRNPGLSQCAEAQGTVVGAALCGHDGRRGMIYHLAVAPEFRGRGLARKIVTAGLAGLRAQGIVRVNILVAKDNAAGRRFWLRQGFEDISGAVPLGMDLI